MTDVPPRKPTLTGRAPRDTAEEVTQLRGEVETALTAVEHRLSAGAATIADLRTGLQSAHGTANAANLAAIAATAPKRLTSKTVFALIALAITLLGAFAALIERLTSVPTKDDVEKTQKETDYKIEGIKDQVNSVKIEQVKVLNKLDEQSERDTRIEHKLDNLARKKK